MCKLNCNCKFVGRQTNTQTDTRNNGSCVVVCDMAHILEKLEGEAVDCIRIRRFVNGFVRNIAKVHFLKLKM